MTAALIISAVCLLAEMFFAAAEISIISCDRIVLRKSAAGGNRAAQLLERFLDNKQRLLATTLTGTQLSVVLSTVIMTYALHHRFGERASLYLLLGLTPTLVVFGEIVPKSLGQQNADRVARRLVYPLWIASYVFQPLVWLLTLFTTWLTRVLGVPERKLVTREELELLLKGPGGAPRSEITEGERRMISRIFEFTETTVSGVMVPLSDVIALSEEATLEQVAVEIEEKQYTRFPVYRERVDHVVGTVHAFDVLKSGRSADKVGAITRPPIFAPESQLAVDLLVTLQRARQGMAIVVDEYGGAVGIATIEDILEEIVGEIEDEHDTARSVIRKEGENVWRVSARASVAEVNRQLKTDLPESEDYESLGGLLLERLKHIPREGESVRIGLLLIRITRASSRSVEEVQLLLGRKRLTPSPP